MHEIIFSEVYVVAPSRYYAVQLDPDCVSIYPPCDEHIRFLYYGECLLKFLSIEWAPSMANLKTLKEIARRRGASQATVAKAARATGLTAKQARNKHYLLVPSQWQAVEKYLDKHAEYLPRSSNPKGKATVPKDKQTALMVQPDPPTNTDQMEFGPLNYPLYLHPSVPDAIDAHAQLRKRLGIILHHLGAHGRTPVVKGCAKPVNKGWRRSPLGGMGGMQFYLWWARQGDKPVTNLGLEPNTIVIREVRHHDEHRPLDIGKLDDYLLFGPKEIVDEQWVGQPWTEDQQQIIRSDAPVRLIMGRPGAGKTSVLWRTVDARKDHRVLYLTWSRELARTAREHFRSFAPKGVHVDTRDWLSFLGELYGKDLPRYTLNDSQRRFRKQIERLSINVRGPWVGHSDALFAEIRAFLLGQAIPDSIIGNRKKSNRQKRQCSAGIGETAEKAARHVMKLLHGQQQNQSLFPDLFAAITVIESLQSGNLREGLGGYDRIVVDEAQDLTLIELAVVVEYTRALANDRGQIPWLLIAGDEGQTVRPSGFKWGPVSDLVRQRIGTPTKYQLQENLRCPDKIEAVINRASTWYSQLTKTARPRKQQHQRSGYAVDTHLLHVDVRDEKEAIALVEEIDELDEVVLVTAQDTMPTWLPDELHDAVLRPMEAKGLEYPSVVLLEPGKLLSSIENSVSDTNAQMLNEQARRTRIDQLRVALSRATETLAFVDVAASDHEKELSLKLLGDAIPYDAIDLAGHFDNSDATPEERVQYRTDEARKLVDNQPMRAWRRAYQAQRLLGKRDSPNSVSSLAVREETYQTVLSVAAKIVTDATLPLDSLSEGTIKNIKDDRMASILRCNSLDDVAKAAAKEAADALGVAHGTAFECLERWSKRHGRSPFELLEAALRLDHQHGQWLHSALESVAQSLRAAIMAAPDSPNTAKELVGDVVGWLRLTHDPGDLEATARELRYRAAKTLIVNKDIEKGDRILAKISPPDYERDGKLWEAVGHHTKAAERYEKARLWQDAYRNWREAGQWEKALMRVDPRDTTAKTDLEWLVSLERLLHESPSHFKARLTSAEKNRLHDLLCDKTPKY